MHRSETWTTPKSPLIDDNNSNDNNNNDDNDGGGKTGLDALAIPVQQHRFTFKALRSRRITVIDDAFKGNSNGSDTNDNGNGKSGDIDKAKNGLSWTATEHTDATLDSVISHAAHDDSDAVVHALCRREKGWAGGRTWPRWQAWTDSDRFNIAAVVATVGLVSALFWFKVLSLLLAFVSSCCSSCAGRKSGRVDIVAKSAAKRQTKKKQN
jgi:hypothetical protein